MPTLASDEKNKESSPSSEYVELKIPRVVTYRLPLLLVLLLCLISFGAGYITHQVLNPSPITDLPSAFESYAKKAKLDVGKFNDCYLNGKYANQVQNDMKDGDELKVEATPTFYINGLPIVGSLPYSIFKRYIDHELQGLPPPLFSNVATPSAKQQVAIGHIQALGQKAPLTVIEFSDFECPACHNFFTQSYPQLKKEYIDTGKITFIYRHYPLTSIHPNAYPAALASECANEQGKFWEYHDILFSNQNAWEELPITAAK